MHLLEFEKHWLDYKLVRFDGKSMPLKKIFVSLDKISIQYGGVAFRHDAFVASTKHILRPKMSGAKILVEKLRLALDGGAPNQDKTVWLEIGELVPLNQTEVELH